MDSKGLIFDVLLTFKKLFFSCFYIKKTSGLKLEKLQTNISVLVNVCKNFTCFVFVSLFLPKCGSVSFSRFSVRNWNFSVRSLLLAAVCISISVVWGVYRNEDRYTFTVLSVFRHGYTTVVVNFYNTVG